MPPTSAGVATPQLISTRVLPSRVGIGLKAEHVDDLIQTKPNIAFLEIHAENYMGAGGPPHAYLSALREVFALSIHGVGLSIGGAGPLDELHGAPCGAR